MTYAEDRAQTIREQQRTELMKVLRSAVTHTALPILIDQVLDVAMFPVEKLLDEIETQQEKGEVLFHGE